MISSFFCTSEKERMEMLEAISVSSIDDLFKGMPIMTDSNLGAPMPEMALANYMKALAAKNLDASLGDFFIGAGCYNHYTPSVVDHVIQRSEFMTCYTPYQSEISQGSLSVMFEFQSMIARLTGMDVANGSMYDGATALAEAVMLANRVNNRNKIFMDKGVHPNYRAVVESYAQNVGMEFSDSMSEEIACVIIQRPDFFGNVAEISRKETDNFGALLIVVVTEIVSLGLLPPPNMADVVVGDAQSLAVPMGFGGPHIGFFACKKYLMRQMPGRVSGQTIDANGERAYTLTISAREQHIKRGRATSNICTNQFLLALAFTIHVSLLGEEGYKRLAVLNHERCTYLCDKLRAIPGVSVETKYYFNEVVIRIPFNARAFIKNAVGENVIAGYAIDDNRLLVAVTEKNSYASIDRYIKMVLRGCAL